VTLETFAQAAAEGGWLDLLHPVDAALVHLPALHLDADAAQRLCAGQAVAPPPQSPPQGQGEIARVYGPDGAFLALATYSQTDGTWHPRKVFYSPHH
jgi:tRNA U55 pseudouridine synthase TruB